MCLFLLNFGINNIFAKTFSEFVAFFLFFVVDQPYNWIPIQMIGITNSFCNRILLYTDSLDINEFGDICV